MLVPIIFSNDCNLDCAYCCITNKGTSPVLSIEKACLFIDDLIGKYGESNLTIEFFGGEPTIHWDKITFIIDKYPNASYKIITNGLFTVSEGDDYYWKKIDDILISIDGHSVEDNAGRKLSNSNIEKIKSNIKHLLDLGIPCGVGIVIGNRKSLLRFSENIEYFSNLGVKYFAIEFVTFFNDSTVKYRTYEEMFYFFEELFEIVKDSIVNGNPKVIHLPRELITGKFFFEKFKGNSCNCSVRAISPRGNIYLCRDHAANEESFIIKSNRVKLIGFDNVDQNNVLNEYMDDGNNFSHLAKYNTLTPCPAKSMQYEKFSNIDYIWWLKDGPDSFQENIIQPIWILIEAYNQIVRDFYVKNKMPQEIFEKKIKLLNTGCFLIGEKLNDCRAKGSSI